MPGFLQSHNETPRLGMPRKPLLFATLSRSELRVVDGLLHERKYLKGEIIFDEGEEGQALHIVIAGRVLICRQGEPDTGRITETEAGDVFGEMALLDNMPRCRAGTGGRRLRVGVLIARRFRKAARHARGDRVEDCAATRASPGETIAWALHRPLADIWRRGRWCGWRWSYARPCCSLLLKQALWLVVPFLLAIILYYALIPAVRRLTLAGVRRETAAAIVAGAFCVAALVAMLPMLPWLAAQATGSEDALLRYLAAGRALIERTLTMLESEFGFLKQLGLHAEMNRMIAAFGETNVRTHLTAALLGAAAWLPSLLLAPFVAFFLLRDGRRFLELMFNAVPNAYFERTLYMVDRVDGTARAYFQGLLALT